MLNMVNFSLVTGVVPVLQSAVVFNNNNNLREPFQSAFRACHSTETVLTKVVKDILLTLDSNSTLLLLFLDLNAAFHTIDHGILSD